MNKKFKKVVATGLAVSSLVTGGMIVKNHNNKQAKNTDHTYTIESGDTLYDISNRYYGTSDYYDEIASYNNIENPDQIKAGDTIKIPNVQGEVNELKEENNQLYVIESGDSLTAICEKFYNDGSYSTAMKLARYNNIENANDIKAGQEIYLPVYEDLMNVNAYPYDYEYDNAIKK